MASFLETLRQGFQKAAERYGATGSMGQAAGTMWTYTTDYFVPNKYKFQVDGGRFGANYAAIQQIETAQEFSIAINAITREVGASEWKVIRQSDSDADPIPLKDEDAPVMRLLRHPNALHSWQSFIETAMQLIFPTGNLYILKDPISLLKTPLALWILRSDRTRPIRDDKPLAPIQGYEHYAEDGRRYVFPPDRVIHVKLPNPFNDYQGLGMTQVLQQTLEMDFRSMESNIQMFRQGGRLSTVIEGADSDPDKAKDIVNKIKEAHMGSQNAHRVLLLTGEMKLNTAASGSQPKEADYKSTREDISRAVGGMLGVPPLYMGQMQNINRATATVQQQMFLKNAVWPMMQRLQPAFDEIVQLFDPSFRFNWTRTDVMDPETMAVLMKNALETGACSPNDAREVFLKLPRVKDPAMDKHYLTNTDGPLEDGVGDRVRGGQPTAEPVAPGAPGKPKPAIAAAKPSPKPVAPLPPAPPPGKLSAPPALGKKAIATEPKSRFPKGTKEQRRILAAIKAQRPSIEKAIAPVFEKHIKDFGARAAEAMAKRGQAKALKLANVVGVVRDVMKAYDASGTPAGVQQATQPIYQVQLANVANDAQAIFGVDLNLTADSIDVADLANKLAQRVTWMDDTLKNQLQDVMTEGANLGLSPYQIANGTPDGTFPGIRGTFDGIAQEHAQLIARTETAHLQDMMNLNAYKKMGVTTCDVIGCEDFVIMPDEVYGCNSQDVPLSDCPINFHPNHNGATVPQSPEE